jgi:magnesium transporter
MATTPRPPRRPHRPPAGSAPGTLIVDPAAPAPVMHLIAYGPEQIEEKTLGSAEQLGQYLNSDRWPVVWLDVDGLGDAALLETIGAAAGLHRLSLADVAHPYQRPKVEDFGAYLFVVARAPFRIAGPDATLDTEQVSLCLGKRFVLSFQEQAKPGDSFDGVRDRLRRSIGAIRAKGPDYLLYALLDASIDAYFPLLEDLGEQMDRLEQAAMTGLEPDTMRRLHRVRREFLTVRRAAWPLREAMGHLHRDQTPLVADNTRIYLRDCYDHTVQILDLVETGRELGTGLMDVHLTLASHRMNEIMKVLTIITSIFIPLSFIAGIYGMNFDTSHRWNMPELRAPYGYIFVLVVMVLLAGAMMFAFWRRGWIGKASARKAAATRAEESGSGRPSAPNSKIV